MTAVDGARILALARSSEYAFSKRPEASLKLRAGLGVEGDVHAGTTVKHRSRVAVDPDQPNLRQVHLIQSELFAAAKALGFSVEPGQLGENVTTRGIDLLALPTATRLRLGDFAQIEVTGLRNPCAQIDAFQAGLLSVVADRDEAGELIRRAGIMAIVLVGGEIKQGDPIHVELPAQPHHPLECV
jgi:MOSC domain-containing protein YiiM